mmetsp:Transcript_542/g.952  ORF Transcript_542/g.952 Transcript_542/m.952 type:complete len:258 (+) Transcript_542:52-825(+)
MPLKMPGPPPSPNTPPPPPPPEPMVEPHVSSSHSQDEVIRKKFGLTAAQLARAKSLRQMGVTEEDLAIAAQIIALMPPQPSKQTSAKSEILLGYDSTRLKREKALKMLGVSEEQLDMENGKILGSLGIDGRKRSFRITRSVSAPVLQANAPDKRGSWFGGRRSSVRSKRGTSIFEGIFEGWNCTNAFGAIDEGPTIEQLQEENEQQNRALEALQKRLAALEAENKALKTAEEERKRIEEEAAASKKSGVSWFGGRNK